MRWRLLRRRLSISSPRMAVRSHLPWPVRWALVAIVLGFSGALALWAFEVGRGLAGLDGGARQLGEQLAATQAQLEAARRDRDRAQSIANTADSLLKTERVTQARLIEQVKALEAENQALKDDLGFFERLLPSASSGVQRPTETGLFSGSSALCERLNSRSTRRWARSVWKSSGSTSRPLMATSRPRIMGYQSNWFTPPWRRLLWNGWACSGWMLMTKRLGASGGVAFCQLLMRSVRSSTSSTSASRPTDRALTCTTA